MTSDPAEYTFAPDERPKFPGSPYTPRLSGTYRASYVAVAMLVGITATLGNALVTVNLATIAGSSGLYVAEATWLPALYVAFNASANLALVKSRAQFGIPPVVLTVLGAYSLAALSQIVWPGFAGALVVRALSGLAAAALTTYTIYHLLQVFPPAKRPMAVVLGVMIPQLGTPLARMLPVEFVAAHEWRGLHEIELAFALASMAATLVMPLPPTDRSKAFSGLDLLTIAMLLPANVLLCAVLNLGRVRWWTDSPSLGWMLVGAVGCYTAVFMVERHRRAPLLHVEWLTTADMLRFAGVAIFVRLALAEQTYGAVGLLTSGGLINDQLAGLFGLVLVAMALGAVTAAVLISPDRLPLLVMSASIVIGAGAVLDSHANSLSRPEQLYVSQTLLGLGTGLFMGPALLYGLLRMYAQGATHLVTIVVLFSATQNIGGIAGSALLGTMQTIEARAHATSMSGSLLASEPAVSARLRSGGQAVSGAVADPGARSVEGGALLGQALNVQASAAAYADIFAGVAILAFGVAAFIGVNLAITRRRRNRPTAVQ